MESGVLTKTCFLAGRATRVSGNGALEMAKRAVRMAVWTTQGVLSSARFLNPFNWRIGRRSLLGISAAELRLLGQELHNGIGQELAGIAHMASALEQKLAKSPKAAADAARIAKLIGETIAHGRDIVSVLNPVSPEPEGLMRALEGMASNVTDRYDISCVFELRGEIPVDDNAVSTHVFRIAQEAVSNAIRHGDAKHISIELKAAGKRVDLVVEDDGAGLPDGWENSPGMGLKTMRQRSEIIGGTLQIERAEDKGTIVTCSFPRRGHGT